MIAIVIIAVIAAYVLFHLGAGHAHARHYRARACPERLLAGRDARALGQRPAARRLPCGAQAVAAHLLVAGSDPAVNADCQPCGGSARQDCDQGARS